MRAFKFCLIAILGLSSTTSSWADCGCGPDFCQNDPRIASALSQKKNSLRANGFPDKLIILLDRGDQCYARITRAPDIFTIWTVDSNGNKQTVSWSADNERIAKSKLASGGLKRYWIYNARHAFSCCGQTNYDQRSDYDKDDDVNTSTAIKCSTESPC